jgi:hypothetical protein
MSRKRANLMVNLQIEDKPLSGSFSRTKRQGGF